MKFLRFIGGADRKRVRGAGRTPTHPALEEKLCQWIATERAAPKRVTERLIFEKAKELHEEMKKCGEIKSDDKFSFSNGWMMRFMHRKNIVLKNMVRIVFDELV